MIAPCRSCRGGFAALMFAVCLLSAGSSPSNGDDAPKKPAGNAWQLNEALEQVAFHSKDPYLQYVALQLGKREGRLDEVFRSLEQRNLPGLFEGRGRRTNADLFSTFTGALAVQESLQLDTMRGERPGRTRRDEFGGAKTIVSGQPKAPVKKLPEKVAVATLVGPSVSSHPWAKMLGAKKPDVGILANCVPEDFYFVEFRSLAKLNETSNLGELFGGHIFTQALGDARSQTTVERIKKQLGLFKLPAQVGAILEIEGIAVTGSDLFLAEGSDVTVLIQGRKVNAAMQLAEGFSTVLGKKEEGKFLEIAYTHGWTPDGDLNVYFANPRPDLHVRSNSLAAFKRVLEIVVGKTADGKPVKRLGESLEFQYIRTLMPRGAAEEDGLIYLSDPFIRRLVGPQVKLTERRRVLVYNHLRMIGHGAMLFRTEHGRAPKSLEELVETKCAPGVFGQGTLAHPDGATYSLSADGMSGVCSKYGRAESLAPCLEHLVMEVSGEEGEEYQGFVREYNEYWRTFFDPIAIRVQASPQQYRLETLILPLIDNSIYSTMARAMGGQAVALDALPVGRREIAAMWAHFDKKLLLDILGPEVIAKKEPLGRKEVKSRVAVAVEAAESTNNLKQLGMAMHAYHDANDRFPPAASRSKDGKPLLSWRVAILPYIEQQFLYDKFKLDEPWDSEHNKKLIAEIPGVFKGLSQKLNDAGKTCLLVPVGKETVFPPDGSKVAMTDISDGAANTILAVLANDESAVIWTKPDDLVFDPTQPLQGLQRRGRDGILLPYVVAVADARARQFRPKIEPATVAALFSRAGGETVRINPEDEIGCPSVRRNDFPFDWTLSADELRELEQNGLDLNKLRRFLRDGIGDQIGLHMHEASKLFDYDVASAFGSQDTLGAGLSGPQLFGIGMLVQFVTGPSSLSIPVNDAKAVDEFLDSIERMMLNQKAAVLDRWNDNVEFYRMPFPKPHTIRCLAVKFAGLKWRLYWGRIGAGLYIANRPFILEDLTAAHADDKRARKTSEPAHAMLRLRPENWKEVLPGYKLGWAEGQRSACHHNLSLLANVNRGWQDRKPSGVAPDAALMERVTRFYGVRPFCPDGGTYTLSADGKSCQCSVHGDARDPRQPAAPTEHSASGKLLKMLAGLSATLTFEEDGLRAVVIVERKE